MLTAILLSRLFLASGDAQGELRISLLFSQKRCWCVSHAHTGEITALTFSPDGLVLASGGLDGQVHIWRASTGTLLQSFCHGSPVERLHWSPNHLLASTSERGLCVWPVRPSTFVC